MPSEQFAKAIAASLARHQSRGLVDDAAGMTDVVIHGRVDLRAVAEDLIAEVLSQAKPIKRSWAAWFTVDVTRHCKDRRRDRLRDQLRERIEGGGTDAQIALDRMRLRALRV